MNWWKKILGLFSLVGLAASCTYFNAVDEVVTETQPLNPCEGTACDNCPGVNNSDQEDMDLDGVGDACDDSDFDGIVDRDDNCPFEPNPVSSCYYIDIDGTLYEQCDTDNDGIGNACDCDLDDDGFNNPAVLGIDLDYDGTACVYGTDNCPTIANYDQDDHDGDGWGDICDDCPAGIGNDADQDGICDPVDNCLGVFNPDQSDLLDENGNPNPDGIGDLCEVYIDTDCDEVPDFQDNCPNNYNPTQSDIDEDGLGDGLGATGGLTESWCDQFACDAHNDVDFDWAPDMTISPADAEFSTLLCSYVADNCREFPNPCQEDLNHNGVGDVCEDLRECLTDADCGAKPEWVPADYSWGCLLFLDYNECGSCYDPDEALDPVGQDMVCNTGGLETSPMNGEGCFNDIDDDGDGLRDCEDLECGADPACNCITSADCAGGTVCVGGDCVYQTNFGSLDVTWTRDTGMVIPSEVVRIRMELRCWDESFNLLFSPGLHTYGDPTDLTLATHVGVGSLMNLDFCWVEMAGLDGLEYQADTLVIWHAIPNGWVPPLGSGENGTVSYVLDTIAVDPTGIIENGMGGFVWALSLEDYDMDGLLNPDDPCPYDATDSCTPAPGGDVCSPVPPTPVPASTSCP